jgi:hypothetical protein
VQVNRPDSLSCPHAEGVRKQRDRRVQLRIRSPCAAPWRLWGVWDVLDGGDQAIQMGAVLPSFDLHETDPFAAISGPNRLVEGRERVEIVRLCHAYL